MTAALDNPVWNGLTGPLTHHSEVSENGRARRFRQDVSPFSAVDRPDGESWEGLAELVGVGGTAVLVRPEVPQAPSGWTQLFHLPCYQMVAGDLPPAPQLELVPLRGDDVDEILALVRMTEPGPFERRTVELGTYVGVRREGKLLAMAGQRFRLPGWCEISAVCTHPDARRQGLGAHLTLWMAEHIRARGEEAFLHVLISNGNAARLYQALGFEIRRTIEVSGYAWRRSDGNHAEGSAEDEGVC